MSLLQRINALPKVLIDLIYQYNVEHRSQMYRIQKELLTAYDNRLIRFAFDTYSCDFDDCTSDEDTSSSRITKCLGHYYKFCSDCCEHIVLYDVRKSYYRRRIKVSPFIDYKTEIKKVLCLRENCDCDKCEDYYDIETQRKEGN